MEGALSRSKDGLVHRAVSLGLAVLLGGCSQGPYLVELMPPPLALEADGAQIEVPSGKHPGILYATTRAASKSEDGLYSLDRSDVMRVGVADVVLDADIASGALAATILDPQRSERILLRVEGAKEMGVLSDSISGLTNPSVTRGDTPRADVDFASEIDRRLKESGSDEVTVYVHGYRVPFAEPVLISAELWHFLNYEGAFVAFSWPSTPRLTAYVRDVDTARIAAKDLRDLLEFISANTKATKINLVGYSMGTRVVLDAVHQLALTTKSRTAPPTVGKVILAGSDVDRGVMGAFLKDGLLDELESLTVYMSDTDIALFFAWFFSRQARVGQSFDDADLPDHIKTYLLGLPKLELVDVANADGSSAGNGHGYFRDSPWVSNDLLLNLRHSLSPKDRGLVRPSGEAVWRFPQDYPKRARQLAESATKN